MVLGAGLAMAFLALVGGTTLLLSREALDRILLPLVAFAAGSLVGGALFHLIPEAAARWGPSLPLFGWVFLGFAVFLLLEQSLHWHHSHGGPPVADAEEPLSPGLRPQAVLILVGDGLHNLLGGLAVGAAFVTDIRLGWAAWLAAAAHEVPQELGDFGVLVHAGLSPRRALFFNLLSALSFPLGAMAALVASARVEVLFLLPFAAGNFLYIGASDLIPEIKAQHHPGRMLLHLACFAGGAGLLYLLAAVLH